MGSIVLYPSIAFFKDTEETRGRLLMTIHWTPETPIPGNEQHNI